MEKMFRETPPQLISDASDSVTNFFNLTSSQIVDELGQQPDLIYQSQPKNIYHQAAPSARTQLGNGSYAIPVKKNAAAAANDYSYQSRLDIIKGRKPAALMDAEAASRRKPTATG